MTRTAIQVRHNIEVAHRLSLLPGKCEAIHGHSMWVTLELHAEVDRHGLAGGLDFGDVKRAFRGHLDDTYDHHLLLNREDEWAQRDPLTGRQLPGLVTFDGDPTTENIAAWVGGWAAKQWPHAGIRGGSVLVQETHVNAARYDWAVTS